VEKKKKPFPSIIAGQTNLFLIVDPFHFIHTFKVPAAGTFRRIVRGF